MIEIRGAGSVTCYQLALARDVLRLVKAYFTKIPLCTELEEFSPGDGGGTVGRYSFHDAPYSSQLLLLLLLLLTIEISTLRSKRKGALTFLQGLWLLMLKPNWHYDEACSTTHQLSFPLSAHPTGRQAYIDLNPPV
jgi:hypothetical protein